MEPLDLHSKTGNKFRFLEISSLMKVLVRSCFLIILKQTVTIQKSSISYKKKISMVFIQNMNQLTQVFCLCAIKKFGYPNDNAADAFVSGNTNED